MEIDYERGIGLGTGVSFEKRQFLDVNAFKFTENELQMSDTEDEISYLTLTNINQLASAKQFMLKTSPKGWPLDIQLEITQGVNENFNLG